MTARRKSDAARPITRRSFVTLVAAGGAALLAQPGLAAGRTRRSRRRSAPAPKPPAPPPPPSAAQKEFDRQRTGTLTTLKTIREFALPPGGDLPVVFRPLRVRTPGGR
jgi:hypothetical protein